MYFKTLSQFYTSSEWRKFRKSLIAERINKEDGILYDEYNGKPLLRDCDIILHHKIELTLDNVNDSSISLNPNNIMVVSPKSHNEIHRRFGGRLKNYQRKVYLVYGAPCSGKSTYVKENMNVGDLVLDMDSIWQSVSNQPRYKKPNELKPIVFDIRNKLLDSIKTRAGSWQCAWIIEGLPLLGERMRRIETLGAEPIYIECSQDECLKRLYRDEERRSIAVEYEQYINEWFRTYQEG